MLSKPAEISIKINKIFEKIMPLFTISGVTLGFLFSGFLMNFRPLVPFIFGIITLSGALRLRARDIGIAATAPIPILLFFLGSRIIMPFTVLMISRLIFRNNPEMVTGFVLLYSVPTAVTSFIWVTIFKGDLALVLALILLDTILAPVLVPGTLRIFLGASVTLNMTGMVITLILMVVLPTILGITLNETSRGKIPAMLNPWLPTISKLLIILVISINTSTASSRVSFDNPDLWIAVAVCIFFAASGFSIGKLFGIAGKLDKERQTALMMTNGIKNNNVAMTLGVSFFPVAVALPALLALIFQHSLAAIMGRVFTGNKE